MTPGHADMTDVGTKLLADQEKERTAKEPAPGAGPPVGPVGMKEVTEKRSQKGELDKGQVEKFEQPEARGKRRGGLEPSVQAQLGGMLRVSYQALVKEPVPERFLQLLERLERTEKLD